MNQKPTGRYRDLIICLVLAAATLAVYWQVRTHEFVAYDDQEYVYENVYVQAGLTRESIVWAFTTGHASNWHPLTWLSHMLDCQIYGLNPAGHHITNLLFHIANTLLLFIVLKRMTRARWQSAFAAALFALHPLHVESVAWVAERKDVLSTLFWMLTMWAYAGYVDKRESVTATSHFPIFRYLLVIVLFALGLMSKPMLVTLPFVLLLIDFWPLGRVDRDISLGNSRFATYWKLVREKTPLFTLSIASSVITYLVQQRGEAVEYWGYLPLRVRLANAVVAYIRYVDKMLWPRDLAVLYPYARDRISALLVISAVLLLACVSFGVYRLRRRCPYLLTGWAWYLGTMVPVIGIIQVGMQAIADRYTYIPLIGLFIIVAWGISDLVPKRRYRQVGLGIPAAAAVAALMICTWFQVGHWRNSVALFTHALESTTDNWIMHSNMGHVFFDRGDLARAAAHYSAAIEIEPRSIKPHYNLGTVLVEQGKLDEAVALYREAVRLDPDYADAHNNLGNILERRGKFDEAAAHYREAIRSDPDDAKAYYNMGTLLVARGNLEDAIDMFTEAVRLNPSHARAHNNLGSVLKRMGRLDEAISEYRQAIESDPGLIRARNNLATAFFEQGKIQDALDCFAEAVRLEPDNPFTRYGLARVLVQELRKEEAATHLQHAITVDPEFAEAHLLLAAIRHDDGKRRRLDSIKRDYMDRTGQQDAEGSPE